MIVVDDSLSRLTTRMIMIAHDSFSAVFPENRRAPLKWPPKVARSRGLDAASEIRVYNYSR